MESVLLDGSDDRMEVPSPLKMYGPFNGGESYSSSPFAENYRRINSANPTIDYPLLNLVKTVKRRKHPNGPCLSPAEVLNGKKERKARETSQGRESDVLFGVYKALQPKEKFQKSKRQYKRQKKEKGLFKSQEEALYQKLNTHGSLSGTHESSSDHSFHSDYKVKRQLDSRKSKSEKAQSKKNELATRRSPQKNKAEAAETLSSFASAEMVKKAVGSTTHGEVTKRLASGGPRNSDSTELASSLATQVQENEKEEEKMYEVEDSESFTIRRHAAENISKLVEYVCRSLQDLESIEERTKKLVAKFHK